MATQENQPKLFGASQSMTGEASELKSAASQVELTEMKDSLLQNFSKAQKAYIVKNLYPELSRALVHFISEAKRHN